MTKVERRNYYVRKWLKSDKGSVNEVYNTCSGTKVSLEQQIKKSMTTINGSRYRVLSHNSYFFTAAFAFPLGYNSDGKPFWYLRVYTPSKYIDYELSAGKPFWYLRVYTPSKYIDYELSASEVMEACL